MSSALRKIHQFVVVIILTCITGFVVSAPILSLYCRYDQYKIKGEPTCIPCPMCPEGEGVNKKCMSAIPYDKDKVPHCVPCIKGKTFSAYSSIQECDHCAPIVPGHHEVVKCNKTDDRVTECKRGYFEHRATHDCDQQCCKCTGQTAVVNKCKRDKMGENLCAPTRGDGKCHPLITTTTTTATTSSTSAGTPEPTSTPSLSMTNTTFPEATNKTNPTTPQGRTSLQTTPSHTTSDVSSNTTSPTEIPQDRHGSNNKITVIVIAIVIVLVVVVLILYVIIRNPRTDNNVFSSLCCLRKSTGGRPRTMTRSLSLPMQQHPVYEQIRDIDISCGSSNMSSPELSAWTSRNATRRNSEEIQTAAINSEVQSLLAALESPIGCTGEVTSDPVTVSRSADAGNLAIQPSSHPAIVSLCQGILLATLRYIHRKVLSVKLDLRGNKIENNWLEFGLHIAADNEILKESVKRCHECYYGGGLATLAMFKHLSTRKPFLKLQQFKETAKRLGRYDVVGYFKTHNICDGNFFDINEQCRTDIEYLLETRKDVECYWPDFADDFGFSSEDIMHFQEQKKKEQKYSPTLELIMVLLTHNPAITIGELQAAALAISRPDVYDCLEEIAQKLQLPDESSA